MKILLTDLDKSTSTLVQIMLEAVEPRVETIWHPTLDEAWQPILKYLDAAIIGFSLSDVKRLELFTQTATIPAIALISTADRELEKLALRHGAQDVLIKDELSARHLSRSITYVIDRHGLIEKIKAKATKDSLTGLYNRRTFTALAEQQLRAAERSRNPLTFLYIDIDDLKTINDTLGHAAGDQAIKAVADSITDTFRQSDIVARIGGDEFVVLAPDTDTASAELVIKRLNQNLEKVSEIGPLSVSTGIATRLPGGAYNADAILHIADERMYKNKKDKKST